MIAESAADGASANVSRETIAPDPRLDASIDAVFGPAAPAAREYHALLIGPAIERGLLGPREATRVWERHILNSVGLVELLTATDSVVDVGSGAGLPGIPIALARPNLAVTLVEPLARRVAFLTEVRDALQLENCEIVHARAEDVRSRTWTIATARAVAPLERLAGWLLPLLVEGGRMLAIKGSQASQELAAARPALHRLGSSNLRLVSVGSRIGVPETTVISVTRAARRPPRPTAATPRRSARA